MLPHFTLSLFDIANWLIFTLPLYHNNNDSNGKHIVAQHNGAANCEVKIVCVNMFFEHWTMSLKIDDHLLYWMWTAFIELCKIFYLVPY